MNRTDISKRTRVVVAACADAEQVAEEDELKLDLGLDSLSVVAVVVALEKEFSVTFDDGELDPERLVTVGDLVGLVERTL